jgi:decaprenylphospho-beta-D-erythro-pentofuranosid-2-ulose 2-reductase
VLRNAVGSVQSVLVLGGGSEIGGACALALVEQGARKVVLAARNPDNADVSDNAKRLTAAGADRVETIPFDADDVANHATVVAKAGAALGGDIDVAIVAFGVLGDEGAAADPETAAAIGRTNYLGAVAAMRALANHMTTQGHGAIVYLSSVAGERVRAANPTYGSSKAGADGFARGLADQLINARSGVQVLVVRPGFVTTKMTTGMQKAPLSTTPDVVAAAMLKGLRSGATVVWAPSALRWMFVVLRHLPNAVFRRMPR